MSAPIPAELASALRVLVDESIGDFVYAIREREGKGWEGPKVTAWSAACRVIEHFAAPPDPEEAAIREARRQEAEELRRQRAEIDRRLGEIGGGA